MEDMTLNEIKKAGIEALVEKLGPIGMIRFLQQYDRGTGDYTKERQKWKYGVSHEEIIKDLKKK